MKKTQDDPAKVVAAATERISRLLAGLLLRDIEDGDQLRKIARLKACGFGNSEIAEMLGTTANTINVAVHSLRRKKKRLSKK
ncbi:MAG: hypothetical protein ACRD4X_13125 [Candidatus Acidiferrales bacterium]